jgi:hypothetical protein
MVLAICALLAAVATSSASAASAPYLSVQAAASGRVKVTLVGNAPLGRLDYTVDGHRVARTRNQVITFFPPRRGADRRGAGPAWHRLAVRSSGARRPLARTRFALGASSSRTAPTLVLLAAPPSRSTDTTAVLQFSAGSRNVACREDTLAYVPCQSPATYTGLALGKHTFTIRAIRGKRRSTIRVVTTTIPAPSTSLPNPGGRQLVFQDDFYGNALNTAAWSTYNSPGHDGNGLRRPGAFTVDGQGHLVITAQNAGGQIVSGGMANRVNRTYGLYEFRVRTEPDPTGTMSGVVLTWPQSGKWPVDGENDIYETGTRASRDPFGSFVHFGTGNDQRHHLHDADAARWHTMAMDWSQYAIKIYRDGKLVWKVTDPNAIPHTPHHLCIQLDAFANRQLRGPVQMQVDWVRIYQ